MDILYGYSIWISIWVNHPKNGSKWTLQEDWWLVLCKHPAFQLQVIEQEPPSKDDQDEDDGHGEAARRSRRRRCL